MGHFDLMRFHPSPPPPTGIVNPGVSPDRVFAMGAVLIFVASMGFFFIDGMIDTNAPGSKMVNAFYCAVVTLTT